MNIAYTINDLYVPMCGVSIMSLLENNKNAREICVYILGDELSEKSIEKLATTVHRYGREIVFLETKKINEIAQGYYDRFGAGNQYVVDGKPTYVTYYRLLLGEVLPKTVEKILYLGSDTLVSGSLEELFNFDMGDKALAVAYDAMNNMYRKRVGLDKSEPYYNDDVILFDLKLWNEKKLAEKVFYQVGKQKDIFLFQQQDGINTILNKYIYTLPIQYNTIAPYLLYGYRTILLAYGIDVQSFYSKKEYEEGTDNPIIYHFAGNSMGRPWYSNSKHIKKAEYDKYYYSSEWKDVMQNERKIELHYAIQMFCYSRLPKWINSIMGIIMQRTMGIIFYSNFLSKIRK